MATKKIVKKSSTKSTKRGRSIDKRSQEKMIKKEEAAFEAILNDQLQGNFGPAKLLETARKYELTVPNVRQLAVKSAQLLTQLQLLSDDPIEQRKLIKAEIVQKIHSFLEMAKDKQDIKGANALITNLSKLYNLYEDESTIQINNNFGVFNSKFSQEEIEHLKKSFELPQTIVEDYKKTLNEKDNG